MSIYHDIISILAASDRPLSSEDICERLEPMGYGGTLSWDDFKIKVTKHMSHLFSRGEVTGIDVPRDKMKPLRHWQIPTSSSVAEVNNVSETTGPGVSDAASEIEADETLHGEEATTKGKLSEIPTTSSQARLRRVPAKARTQKKSLQPITLKQAMDMRLDCGIEPPELEAFLMGVLEAEIYFGEMR